MGRTIAIATLTAGALDILYAALMSSVFGRGPAAMLRMVASGPFPAATKWGATGSGLGLAVHFTLMAIMAACFVIAARNWPALLGRPIRSGVIYGLITYAIMNWLVVPIRFGTPLPPEPRAIVSQLFAHIALVGIPIALVAAKNLRTSSIS
jgi:uncharacterized membrane protein YagU involved in acid resistance